MKKTLALAVLGLALALPAAACPEHAQSSGGPAPAASSKTDAAAAKKDCCPGPGAKPAGHACPEHADASKHAGDGCASPGAKKAGGHACPAKGAHAAAGQPGHGCAGDGAKQASAGGHACPDHASAPKEGHAAAGKPGDCCAAKAGSSYGRFGLTFQAPVPLVEEEAGVDAWTFSSAKTGTGRAPLYVMLARVAPGMKEAMSRPELLQAVKATFMATAIPGDKVTRNLLGQAVEGERQKTTVPQDSVIETFLVDLPNGDTVAVGLSYSPGPVAEAEGEAFILAVAESLEATK